MLASSSTDSAIEKTVLRCSDSNRYLVFIPKEGYCFAGTFRFQCLLGDVTVNGYTVRGADFHEDKFIQFSSHNRAQLPSNFVPLVNDQNTNNLQLLFQRIRLILDCSIDDFKEFANYPAALLCDFAPNFTEAYLTNRIGEYHRPLNKFKYYHVAGDCFIVKGVKGENEKLIPINSHIPHEELVKEAIDYAKKRSSVLMITGNKDMGKSTLVRYIVNYMLSGQDRTVYLLDTDIGQTEFTPPGCVSLFKVDKPILTPVFLHQSFDFPNTYCVGSLSPVGLDRTPYLQSIARLKWEFDMNPSKDKFLIVNTHGWVDGLGFLIMKDLFARITPTAVINLYMEGGKNLDIPAVSFTQHHYQYRVVPRINSATSKEIVGKTWREYSITGYFANCLGDLRFGKPSLGRTLANLMSYQVFFNKISLCFHHQRPPVVDHLVFSSLNCSIVALCAFMSENDKNKFTRERLICKNEKYPKIITMDKSTEKPLIKCYGFGFIRAISLEKNIFYVISPISADDCGKVQFFFIPNAIVAPNYMFDRDDANAAPYLVEFKNEQERQSAIKDRNENLRLLSSRFQDTTGARSAVRSNFSSGNATKRKNVSAGPASKKPRRN